MVIDRFVSNASPLIYLAKADRLEALHTTANKIFIPEGVYQEVVIEGKRLEEDDAYRVERAIAEGWMLVRERKIIHPVAVPIHPGEAELISLAKEMEIERVLLDDNKARIASELAGLKPIGTLGIILMAVRDGNLSFDEFLATIENIVYSGFYLKEDVYLRAVQEAKRLSDL